MSKLKQRLKEERLAKGYTQNQLALYLGVTYNAISNYESGVREPSLDTLIKICQFLEVSADYLIGLTDN